MAMSAEWTIRAALIREESRGVHAGEDGRLPRRALGEPPDAEARVERHEPAAARKRLPGKVVREVRQEAHPVPRQGVHDRIALSRADAVEEDQQQARRQDVNVRIARTAAASPSSIPATQTSSSSVWAPFPRYVPNVTAGMPRLMGTLASVLDASSSASTPTAR